LTFPSPRLGRVLISELDSLVQARLFRASRSRPEDAIETLTAYLRVGSLVADRVVITDAMLLDGAYFLTLGPTGVAAALGRGAGPLPLLVTSPHASLAEALRSRLRKRGFQWSLDSTPLGRAAGAKRWPTSTASAWQEWISASERGLIDVEMQVDEPLTMLFPPAPSVSARARAVEKALRREKARSEALKTLRLANIPADDEIALRDWWSDAYVGLLARRARADWISFDSAEGAPAGYERIPMPSALVEWARRAGPASFSLGWDASQRRREMLLARPSWTRMRDLAFVATAVSRPASRRRVLVSAAVSVVFATAAVIVDSPFWGDSDAAQPVTWLAFAVVLVTTFPVTALRNLWGLLARESRATLTVRTGARNA
jgi:hypothetical protein